MVRPTAHDDRQRHDVCGERRHHCSLAGIRSAAGRPSTAGHERRHDRRCRAAVSGGVPRAGKPGTGHRGVPVHAHLWHCGGGPGGMVFHAPGGVDHCARGGKRGRNSGRPEPRVAQHVSRGDFSRGLVFRRSFRPERVAPMALPPGSPRSGVTFAAAISARGRSAARTGRDGGRAGCTGEC